jgi:hypothetical protein
MSATVLVPTIGPPRNGQKSLSRLRVLGGRRKKKPILFGSSEWTRASAEIQARETTAVLLSLRQEQNRATAMRLGRTSACHLPKNGAQFGEPGFTVVPHPRLLERPMMKKLSFVGIVAGAALSTATPVSLDWTPQRVTLSVDQADAQTGARVQRRVYRRAYRQPYYAYTPYSGYWTYPFYGYGLFPYRLPGYSPFR